VTSPESCFHPTDRFQSHPKPGGFFCSAIDGSLHHPFDSQRAPMAADTFASDRLSLPDYISGKCLAKTGLGGSTGVFGPRGLTIRARLPTNRRVISAVCLASAGIVGSTPGLQFGEEEWQSTVRTGAVGKEPARLARPVPEADFRFQARCPVRASRAESGPRARAAGPTRRPPLDRQFETVRSIGRPNERKVIYESKRDFADRRCNPSR